MKHFYSVAVLLLLFVNSAQAQFGDNGSALKMAIAPPTPEAASLGKFMETPVGYYTGVPTISVPIATLRGRKLSSPVSLSYHAGGIKVEEMASRVGLGWALNYGGGSITRSMHGIPDDTDLIGWLALGTLGVFEAASITDPEDLFDYAKETAKGEHDMEPDVFMYNFGGQSGKFLFEKDGTVQIQPVDRLKVSFTKNLSGQIISFLIIDLTGTKYYFGKSADGSRTAFDAMTMLSGCNSSIPLAQNYHSAWYLLDIIEANGDDTVKFTYEDYESSACTKSTETWKADFQYSDVRNLKCYSFSEFVGSRITSVETSLEKVQFVYDTDRLDLPGDQALDSIKIFNNDSIVIKSFSLAFDYFSTSQPLVSNSYCSGETTQSRSTRLKLLSVQEHGYNGTDVPPYKFDYIESPNLPERFSNQQDHWGFYNGRTNNDAINTMIPREHYIPLLTSTHMDLPGANRSVKSSFIGACTLNKISYPTGGTTFFEYEGNTAINVLAPYPLETELVPYVVGNGVDTSYEGESFTIEMLTDSGAFVQPKLQNVTCSVGTFSCGVSFTIQGVTHPGISIPVTGTNDPAVFLKNGDYVLKANIFHGNDSSRYFEFSASWEKEVYYLNKPVGGLRLKRMTVNDSLGNKTIKRYKYHFNDSSSGRMSGFVKYQYYTADQLASGIGPGTFYNRSSVSKAPLATTQGSVVGYGHVQELFGENGENGKIEYYFTEPGAWPTHVFAYPYPPSWDNEWHQGLLIRKETYKRSGDDFIMISKEETQFEDIIPNGDRVDVFGAVIDDWAMDMNPFIIYSNQAGKEAPVGSVNTSYTYDSDDDLIDSLVTSTSTYYDTQSHLQVTRTETEDSEGRLHRLTRRYPADMPSDSTLITMINKNMIALPLETVHTLDTIVISGQKNLYDRYGSDVRLKNVYEAEIIPVATDTSLHLHTNYKWIKKGTIEYEAVYGNVSAIAMEKNLTTSYLWGRNHSLPVAEVKNAATSLIYYNGFEDGDGNSSEGNSWTGSYSHTGSYAEVINGLVPGKYILDYREKSGDAWEYHQETVTVSGTSYTIPFGAESSGFQIDELRFYPIVSTITTYAYNAASQVSSSTDTNGQSTFYDYDDLGRLQAIRDNNKKILKTFRYHYRVPGGGISGETER